MKSLFDYFLEKSDKKDVVIEKIETYHLTNSVESYYTKNNKIQVEVFMKENKNLHIILKEDIDYSKNNYIYFQLYKTITPTGIEKNDIYIGKYIDIDLPNQDRKKNDLSLLYRGEEKEFMYLETAERDNFEPFIKFVIENDLFLNTTPEQVIENISLIYDKNITKSPNMSYLEERIKNIKAEQDQKIALEKEAYSKMVKESIRKLMHK